MDDDDNYEQLWRCNWPFVVVGAIVVLLDVVEMVVRAVVVGFMVVGGVFLVVVEVAEVVDVEGDLVVVGAWKINKLTVKMF